jgi:polar amino acid transport system substrate-binding protein
MKNIILSALVAAIVVFGISHYAPQQMAAEQKQETVYERVQRTGVLRCGYGLEPPMLSVDPNTGKVAGATVEIVEQIAALLNWKVVWTEQVAWSEMTAGLMANRYDLVCNGKWVFAPQAKGGQFTIPIYFTAVHAYGRADETRLDDKLTGLNSDSYTLTSMDGEMNYYIARSRFPNAKRVEFPGLTEPGQLILAITTKKADVTFLPAFLADDYMAKNPGQIRQLTTQPLSVFDTAFMYKTGEAAFGGVLDAALRQLRGDGAIDATLDKYGVPASTTLRVATPYRLPN